MTTVRAFLYVIALFVSGCATNLQVTYSSEPMGAAVYEGDRHLGTTPVTLTYPLTDEQRKAGSTLLRGVSVRWVSGATASISSLTADLRQYGYHQSFTFRRPDGVPGYETDARYALELQRNAIMMYQAVSQAEAARQAAADRQRALQLQQQQLYQQQSRPSMNCSSYASGSYIYTNCQ